jgi:hypothetical protein
MKVEPSKINQVGYTNTEVLKAVRWLSSGFLHLVGWYKLTDVSEVLAASIISVISKPHTVNFYQMTRRNGTKTRQ